MSEIPEFDVGDRVIVETAVTLTDGTIERRPFRDRDDVAFDPNVVTFEVKAPGLSTASYVYLTDSEVTKNATGDYTLTIDVDIAGTWYYYIFGEQTGGENRAAFSGKFKVIDKRT